MRIWPGRMRGRLLGAVAAMIVAGGCSAAPGDGSPASAADGFWNSARLASARPLYDGTRIVPLPDQTPSAHTAAGALRVGALFEQDASGGHYCTASVVASPGADSPASAAAGFWNSARLASARPLYGGTRIVPLPGQTPSAHTAAGALRVGALFEQDANGGHYCTASVVASPGENLLITAAHCINDGDGAGYKSDIVFIPGYRDGSEPYGVWTPRRLLVAPQWADSADPDFDVGFVVLQPRDGENIQQVLGANQLGFNTGYRNLVRVTGYPSSDGAPITCVNWTSQQSATQLRFDCDGYADGTSGSPWVTHFDPRSRTGTIVGVIGGYEEGGDTPSVSYSAYFGSGIQQLYLQATTG